MGIRGRGGGGNPKVTSRKVESNTLPMISAADAKQEVLETSIEMLMSVFGRYLILTWVRP